jgi:hypothetical protein
MDIFQLTKNLRVWRAQRSIDTKSSMGAQLICLAEERLELMDAIGDCAVCVINAEALGFDTNKAAGELDRLERTAAAADVDFNACLRMAWNQIKGRVGLINDIGKFTKWDNLTHVQRLTVAASGQLDNMPSDDLANHRRHCTYAEWMQIEWVLKADKLQI